MYNVKISIAFLIVSIGRCNVKSRNVIKLRLRPISLKRSAFGAFY